MIGRRALLAAGLAQAAGTALPPAAADGTALLDDIAERTFRFFWETGDPVTGLVPDRWPSRSACSIAAVGFALTAYPIGVERGWIGRPQARARTLATLRFFDRAPSGPHATGVSGHRGLFYHFLDMKTGLRVGETELSTVDTALLHMGMLFSEAWFDGDDADEREIRRLASAIVARADWPWTQTPSGLVSMGWHPGSGFLARGWDGYNEGKLVYVLGLGSRGHPLPDGAWNRWAATYPSFWRGSGPTRHLAFAPLFGHQYTEMWVDFRGILDAPMREAGWDYVENGRRATYANRAYCIANPGGWDGYGPDLWGLTACDGPGDFSLPYRGGRRQFHGYSARGPVGQPDGLDDGTIAPTASLGSLAYAPEIVIPAARAMRAYGGGRLYKRYGFVDSFNPSFRLSDRRLKRSEVDPLLGWADTDHLGIDQGPILGAIANHRDGMIWRTMRRSQVVRHGLERAGFTGGWLAG